MTLWVLDTDHVTLHQQFHLLVTRRMAAIAPDDLAVTIITVEEQLRGRFNIIKKYGTTNRQVQAYRMLGLTLNYFHNINVLDFDQAAYTQFETLRQQRIRIGSQDLRIAAIVLAINGVLLTRNRRDFSQVPGLALEDWSLP